MVTKAGKRRGTQADVHTPLLGSSRLMRTLRHRIEDVAPTEATVLIVGESGSGKELVARSICQLSHRAQKPFVAVNCGGMSASLLEAHLFGHERGSFTGAAQQRAGYFEQSNGGTLFLDEITEMPVQMQTALLRALEEKRFRRIGGEEEIEVDVRVIAATNRNPAEAVREGKLREDLMYRLSVFPIEVPPLRHRENDVLELADHFLQNLNMASGTRKHFSPGSRERMQRHRWPGNVRELRNSIHRAFILADSNVEVFPTEMSQAGVSRLETGDLSIALGTRLADAQRALIMATLAHFGGDKEQAARTLGVCLKTLYNRLSSYAQEADMVAGADE
jgi:DNA-binding NtrC family response regulator